jgi:hypothetical protein
MIIKRKVWIAPYLFPDVDVNDNPIDVYDKPFEIECSLNSLSGSTDIAAFGERIKHMAKTILDYKYIEDIHEQDKAYLYGRTPSSEENNGDNANYQVVAIMPQNRKIQVYFEKLPNE